VGAVPDRWCTGSDHPAPRGRRRPAPRAARGAGRGPMSHLGGVDERAM